jgi:hypothetical protein
MRENKLYLRHDKCDFEKEHIEYLGVIISHNYVEIDPVKVAGVREWPVPKSKKEVQSFVGFANFYRRFITGFSHHTHALFDLTKKDVKFEWTEREQRVFDKIKEAVTSAPVLVLPDRNQPFRIEADGSGFATGAVLSQLSSEDNKWHPVVFLSKSLNEVERNYQIHDTEMLAIIRALEEWQNYLEGAKHSIEILTDHKNLEYFHIAQKLNRRQARWSLYLSQFDFTLHHQPGKSMGKPDALSRRADHGSGSNDNSNLTLLGPELFQIHALSGLAIEGKEKTIAKDIRLSLRDGNLKEPVAKAACELRMDRTRGTVKSAEWTEQEGLLMFRGKIYVPTDRNLCRRIVSQHHDTHIAGHAGRWKTLELVAWNYWCPQMLRFIGLYVKTCDLCQQTKVQRSLPAGELHPPETPLERWDTLSVDFVVELYQQQDDWDKLLPMGEFAYNNHVHSSSQQTPFMVDTGRHPRMGFELNQPRSQVVEVREFAERMAKGVEEVRVALTKAKDEYAMYYNRRRTPAPKFKPDDRVWLDSSDIHTDRPSAKLADRALGPYKVEQCVGCDTYRLTLPFSMRRLCPNFSAIKLRLAPDDPFPGRCTVPPPDLVLIDGETEYDVEAILDSHMRYRRMEYLVKWKGYDTGYNSWEPHYNLRAPLVVTAFHHQHSGAPRSISFAAFDSLPFSREHLSSNWRLSHWGGET